MKICLIMPPSNSDVKKVLGVIGPPPGLVYLASVLRTEHEVEIIDAVALDYSMVDLKRELEARMPDVVGITAVTSTIYNAYDVAKIAKEGNKDCVVVLGGPMRHSWRRRCLPNARSTAYSALLHEYLQ